MSKRVSLSRYIRSAALIGASLLLAGCESLPDVPDVVNPLTWFEDDEPAPSQGAAANKGFPKLSSVPERPAAPSLESQQAKIRQGLVADQRNARYTDSQVRREADRRVAGGPSLRRVPAVPTVPRAPQSVATPTSRRVPPPPILRSRAVPPPPPVRRSTETRVAARPAVPPVASAPRLTAPPPVLQRQVPTTPSLVPPGQPIKIGTIYFADNSKVLQRGDLTILRQIAEAQRSTGRIIRIVGHASGRVRTFDPARRARINYEVSLDRANSIAAALAGMGVPADKIQAEGAGDTAPIYAEYTTAGEAANRRAELFLLN